MKKQLQLLQIKQSSRELMQTQERKRNSFLKNLSVALEKNKKDILKANKIDVYNAVQNGLGEAFIQRLILNERELNNLQNKLLSLQKLNSSIGSVIEEKKLANGLLLKKISVSLGVILVIYEARPEVTIDVAALCIKSGNAAILKGGSEAMNTNIVLFKCIQKALQVTGFNKNSVSFVEKKEVVGKLLEQNKYIDIVIARGGYAMVKNIINQSKIPVLAHSAGGARIYIDASADLAKAMDIIINAKISKPAACNSLDTVLIHKNIVHSFVIKLVKEFQKQKVTVLGDEYISKFVNIKKTKDWDSEFLGLTVSLKQVDNEEEAIQFITKHSKNHSEGIIAQDKRVINKFTKSIDAAALFVNCSTRFHDGYEFDLGSEMGIATGKLHARGPVGLKELTTYKWEVYGNGQTR